jgi:hypothetical protein
MPFKKDKSTVIFLPRAVAAQFGKNASKAVSRRLNKTLRNASDEDLGPIVGPREATPPTNPNPGKMPPQEHHSKLRNLRVQIRKDQRLRLQELTGGRISLAEVLRRLAMSSLVDIED